MAVEWSEMSSSDFGRLVQCYETIMFGRVTRTLDPAAMRVRSLVYVIYIL